MAILLDGKALAEREKVRIRERVGAMARKPKLVVILAGDDPASRVYVNAKKKDCAECGMLSEEFSFPREVLQDTLLSLIKRLNEDAGVDGILVQLPLPRHIDSDAILKAIDPQKDVDCFHPYNVGLLMQGNPFFAPCTPAGVVRLLEEYGIEAAGRHCVVIGRSNIVGKPQAMLLLNRDATVSVCHSRTRDLGAVCKMADILISAAGKTDLITADMVKEGAVVVDVAMNRDAEGKLCGDVRFAEVSEKASHITPVPGGVGPMTRIMLLDNTLKAAELR